MTGQVALLDMSRAQLDAHLDGLWIDSAFADFVALSRQYGVPLKIVSDGLDYAIQRLLQPHGLHDLPLTANALQATHDARRWQLATPHAQSGCQSGACKCAVADAARQQKSRVLLIGDGASDFCVAARADFVFAKSRLIEHCRAMGLPYLPITGFEDAMQYLPQLLAGELTAPQTLAPAASLSP